MRSGKGRIIVQRKEKESRDRGPGRRGTRDKKARIRVEKEKERKKDSPYSYDDFDYADWDYIDNDFDFVTVFDDCAYIERYYFYCGCWGHANDFYDGRNYHFYLMLFIQNYFGPGHKFCYRRFFGDGLEAFFGWNPIIYLLIGWWQYGSYYFEPCYAFSFTFNHGYEVGYVDGFCKGVGDWNAAYPYRSWQGECNGYKSYWGPEDEYCDGYEQGFRQGYYAGYCGYPYGYYNFGFGDFTNYPVIYDFDYDYYDNNQIPLPQFHYDRCREREKDRYYDR